MRPAPPGCDEDRTVAPPPGAHRTPLDRAGSAAASSGIVVDVVSGPDCRERIRVCGRRIVVGRDRAADLTIDDPTIGPHHLLLEVADRSDATDSPWLGVTPLIGSSRVVIDDRAVTRACRAGGTREPVRICLGASELVIRSATDVDPDSDADRCADEPVLVPTDGVGGGDERWIVQRRFVAERHCVASAIGVPTRADAVPGPPSTALVGAATGVLGALVVARVLGNAMFAVFAGVAATVALVTYAASWVSTFVRRRRDRRAWTIRLDRLDRELGAARAGAVVERRGMHAGIAGADRSTVSSVGTTPLAYGLWSGTPDSRVEVVVGRGDVAWSPPVTEASSTSEPVDREVADRIDAHRTLHDVPVTVGITRGSSLAIVGAGRHPVGRSVVAQLAWHLGPAHLRLVVVTDRPDRWRWATGAPHLVGSDGEVGVLDARDRRGLVASLAAVVDDLAAGRRLVVVVDLQRLLEPADGPIRSLLDVDAALVVLDEHAPAWVDAAVDVAAGGTITGDVDRMVSGRACGITAATAEQVAVRLSRFVDPESGSVADMPDVCGIAACHALVGDVDPLDPGSVLAAWSRSGTDPAPVVTIGIAHDQAESIDLLVDGPHAVIAGTTGSGKSELLRSLVVGLAVRTDPRRLAFLLIDYKGGSAFDACAELPHVAGVVTDLDGGLAARALRSLDAELRRRERRLREADAEDLAAYRRTPSADDDPIPRLVVVVDEFAALARDLPGFLASLVDVARRGRSLGVHLVLATQRPGGVVDDDLRANTGLRIALRTTSPSESIDVIGSADAARISRRRPGRALRSLGGGVVHEFQSAAGCFPVADGSGPAMTELEAVVAAVRTAAVRSGVESTPATWTPPLPDVIDAGGLSTELAIGSNVRRRPVDPAGVEVAPIGVVDDPDEQCRRPLFHAPGDGSLALVGSIGSGTTSALIAIVAAACASRPPSELEVVVIDARRDSRLDALDAVAHVRGVIRPNETERLRRALEAPSSGRPAMLLIDGLDALRVELRSGPDQALDQTLVELVAAAADRGVEVVATTRSDLGVLAGAFRHTWVGALDDPPVARSLGWTDAPMPSGVPGRFGISSSGLVAQLARGAPGLAALPTRSETDGPPRIDALPESIDLADLGAVSDPGADGAAVVAVRSPAERPLPIGLGAATQRPDGPALPPGAHLLVVGRPRSGVSTCLATIESVWRRRHDGGSVLHVDSASADPLADLAALVMPGRAGEDDLTRGMADRARGPVLVVVDDADRVDDRDGVLAALCRSTGTAASHVGGMPISVVAGGRADAVRSAFGHWTKALVSSERGIALAASGEPPTDVFGAPPPRRPLVAARPGLGWLVDGSTVTSVQIARSSPA